MKKGIGIGLLLSIWLACVPAWADGLDSVGLLRTDYVGVGGIDMPKFVQRRIYTYLMDFFVTDMKAKQALSEIRSAGICLEDILTRIVVGIPADVERSEHIVLWETSENLSKYKPLISAHSQAIDTRSYLDIEYFATKRENECLAILENVLVLGSELRVKEVVESYKNGYRGGPANEGLQSELRRVNRAQDVWFVFGLSDKERKIVGRADPLLDKTAEGLGMLKLGDIQRGNIAMDFSSGIDVKGRVVLNTPEAAKQTASLLNAFLAEVSQDQDVKELGFDSFVPGIKFGAEKADVTLNVIYNQKKFEEMIALVTQLAKSIQHKGRVAVQ